MIRNFFIVLWCFWGLCPMLCLCIKLLTDRVSCIRRAGRLAYIQRCFHYGQLDKKRARRRFAWYVKDDILFFHMCECCLAGRQERGRLRAGEHEQLLQHLVNQKKAQKADCDELLRELIAVYEREAGEEEQVCAAS